MADTIEDALEYNKGALDVMVLFGMSDPTPNLL